MTMQGDAIFKEKLTGGLKNDIKNLVNFHGNSLKYQNLHFDGLLLSIAYEASPKKSTEDLSLMGLVIDPNFEEKLTFCLKNDMKNFNASSRKSENWQGRWATFVEIMYCLS